MAMRYDYIENLSISTARKGCGIKKREPEVEYEKLSFSSWGLFRIVKPSIQEMGILVLLLLCLTQRVRGMSTPVVLNRGNGAPTFWPCVVTFLVVPAWEAGWDGVLLTEMLLSILQWTTWPPTRLNLLKMSVVPRLRNPDSTLQTLASDLASKAKLGEG